MLVVIDKVVAHSEGGSLESGVHSKFGQQSLYVTSHGGRRDAEPQCHRRGIEPLDEQGEAFSLAGRQVSSEPACFGDIGSVVVTEHDAGHSVPKVCGRRSMSSPKYVIAEVCDYRKNRDNRLAASSIRRTMEN